MLAIGASGNKSAARKSSHTQAIRMQTEKLDQPKELNIQKRGRGFN
jgi:hypothetical protein